MLFSKYLKKTVKVILFGVTYAAFSLTLSATTISGASMFDIDFELCLNGELAIKKDYFTYLNQGLAINYVTVAPSHIARFTSLMDMLFLVPLTSGNN